LVLDAIVIAFQFLHQESAGLGLRHFVLILEVVQVIKGIIILFFGIFQVDDGMCRSVPAVSCRSLSAFSALTSSS